jgi:hypothetical protein
MNSKFVTAKEIAELAECCNQIAREILKEVNEIVEERGMRVVSKRKAPRKLVLEYIGLEENKQKQL